MVLLAQTPTATTFDWPCQSHHCNIYCRFELEQVRRGEANTIAVVRARSENFRSNSRLYSQKDISSESLIPLHDQILDPLI